jgi:hypothetical protein
MINYKKRERRRDDGLRKGQHKVEILMKNKQIESYLWSIDISYQPMCYLYVVSVDRIEGRIIKGNLQIFPTDSTTHFR